MENKNDKKPTLPNKPMESREDKDATIAKLQNLLSERTRQAQELLETCKSLRTIVQKLSALI